MKADNIARSKSIMARQAIKASATATRIPDEIAARNSERSSERKRIQDAQKTSDATTEDEVAMMAYVLEATNEDERRLGRTKTKKRRQRERQESKRTRYP